MCKKRVLFSLGKCFLMFFMKFQEQLLQECKIRCQEATACVSYARKEFHQVCFKEALKCHNGEEKSQKAFKSNMIINVEITRNMGPIWLTFIMKHCRGIFGSKHWGGDQDGQGIFCCLEILLSVRSSPVPAPELVPSRWRKQEWSESKILC